MSFGHASSDGCTRFALEFALPSAGREPALFPSTHARLLLNILPLGILPRPQAQAIH